MVSKLENKLLLKKTWHQLWPQEISPCSHLELLNAGQKNYANRKNSDHWKRCITFFYWAQLPRPTQKRGFFWSGISFSCYHQLLQQQRQYVCPKCGRVQGILCESHGVFLVSQRRRHHACSKHNTTLYITVPKSTQAPKQKGQYREFTKAYSLWHKTHLEASITASPNPGMLSTLMYL